MNETWVLEWSFRQKCFHVTSVDEMLSINLAAFKNNRGLQFIPIGVFDSSKAAHDAAEKLHPILEARR